MKMTLDAVMRQEPTLTRFGFGVFDATPADRDAQLAEGRADLLAHAERIQDICEWIWLNLKPIRSLNSHRSSYGLKHIVEKDLNYVANGEFIAAMMMRSYRYEKEGGPNAWFNVSEKTVKAVTQRQEMEHMNRGLSVKHTIVHIGAWVTNDDQEDHDKKDHCRHQ